MKHLLGLPHLIVVLVLYLCFAGPAGARQQPPPSGGQPPSSSAQAPGTSLPPSSDAEVVTTDATPTFSSRVNVVPVSVIVRDRKGRAVGGLTRDDFSLTDNGKPQVITRFSAERSDTPVVPPKEAPVVETPAAPVRSEPVLATRFFVYLFDDIHLKFDDLVNAREAASHHVATALQPADRVAIHTTSGRTTLEFTDDRDKLRAALSRLRPSPLTGGPTTCPYIDYYVADLIVNKNDQRALQAAWLEYKACSGKKLDNESGRRAVILLARSALAAGEQEARMAARGLQEAIRRLSTMPGQRSIVLASPGFFSELEEQAGITSVINQASAARVIINSLDARGVWTPPVFDLGLETPGGGLDVLSVKGSNLQHAASAQGDVLGELADGTGGLWIHGTNDLKGAFRRLASVPEYSYALSYSPDNLKSDGKYHDLKVSLKNPKGLTLQARKGYFALRRETSPDRQARQDLEDALFARDVVKNLPVELQTGFLKPPSGAARLSVLARLDLKALPYRKAEGRNLNSLTIVSAVFDLGGNYIAGAQKDVELRLKDETLANFAKPASTGLTIRTSFDVKPGNYVVRLVVRDGESHSMASENAVVDIP